MNSSLPAQSFDWRLEWRWLLALSFLLLLPTKNLWSISVLVIAVLGLLQLVRGHIPFRGDEGRPNRTVALMFAALWLPMLFSLPTAVALDHSASTTPNTRDSFSLGLE